MRTFTAAALFISILLLVQADAKRRKQRESSEEDEDDSREEAMSPGEWEAVACATYDNCLDAIDDKTASCGGDKARDFDASDICYEPIARQHERLVKKKEEKNQLLRECFLSGKVGQVKKDKHEKDAVVSKRHQTSCRHKFGELEQFFNSSKRNSNGESCAAGAKKLKERCQKIESCCPRIKSCRLQISKHPIIPVIYELEGRIKDQRRACKERE